MTTGVSVSAAMHSCLLIQRILGSLQAHLFSSALIQSWRCLLYFCFGAGNVCHSDSVQEISVKVFQRRRCLS